MEPALDAVKRVMSTTVGRWQSIVDTLPEELLERPPAPGEWSAIDCLRHLLTVERHEFYVRLIQFLEGRAELIPFNSDAPREPEPEQTPRELIAAFATERRASMAALAQVMPADMERTSHHPKFGAVTLGMLLNQWAAHDLQHAVQAEEALMQAFIPGTGVWRFEFEDHDIEAGAATSA